ncbi:TniQ family protein [Marinomonas sp. 2405UD66-6]|uniref:TniQ family protein n=1 Tax=Marinomonas sp. 2405UD66-6 TaxID=3391834 RepID=UPI0039C9218F
MKPIVSFLIEPLIHPAMKADEDPFGYLIRIAELNEYTFFHWLNARGSKTLSVSSPHNLYPVLANTKWARCDLNNPVVKEVLALKVGYFVPQKLRFCPLCIRDYGYFKVHWRYKTSVACLEHKIWLHDHCYLCGKAVSTKSSKVRFCSCGADITETDVEKVSRDVLSMQLFFEGALQPRGTNLSLFNGHEVLNKEDRIVLLNFFSKWLRNRMISRSGISTSLRDMQTAKDNMKDVAEALFSGHAGYHNFLKRLHALGCSSDGTDLFIKFYRSFYLSFPQACFQPYKDYLERYINKYWEKPLTKKNHHFDKKTLDSHPWIPFQTACRDYDLNKSELSSAIKQNLVCSKVTVIESRQFTLIYKPDLEARLYRIKDLICAKQSASILGVTKLQFYKLQESGCFDVMIKPNTYGKSIWQFSKDEILRYRSLFLQDLTELSGDYWTFSELLKYFGGQIENSLITLLRAIEAKDLKVSARLKGASGLPSMLFDKSDFKEWYEGYKAVDNLLSIPVTAKLLGLQQQFTYQLVDTGLIETQSKNGTTLKWVSQKGIDDFRERYVLLAKLAKRAQISSKALMKHLADREIYPIDEQWKVPLRQKVYERQYLANVQLIADHLSALSN